VDSGSLEPTFPDDFELEELNLKGYQLFCSNFWQYLKLSAVQDQGPMEFFLEAASIFALKVHFYLRFY